jgi:FkbM family methyltransferase
MNFISETFRKINRSIQYIENPDLWYIRQNDGVFELYANISQPWLKNIGIKTILDIGANTGQSTVTFARVFPDAKIYAFEPIPDCYQKLEAKFADNNRVSTINIGVGAEQGELSLELSNFSPSSSFLEMDERHLEAFPFTTLNKKIVLPVDTLDNIFSNLSLEEPILAKIDVQGFEDKVIAGGRETIKKCQLIIIETSFDTLYKGQSLFDDIYNLMLDMGFKYAGSMGQILEPGTQRCLQSDSLFIKDN